MSNDFAETFNIDTNEGLSMQVAILDTKGIYDEHAAMWWDTDSPIPMCRRNRTARKFKIAVPVVWKSAPEDVLELMLQQQVECWHNYPTLEGKPLKTYLQSQKFVKDLRRLIPQYVPNHAKDPMIRTAMRNMSILLGDRPSKIKDIVVTWREEPADLMFSPVASTNQYARVIWLDPVLLEEEQEVINWVIYHEVCTICSLSYANGKPKKTQLKLLEGRFPRKEMWDEYMDSRGWTFEYDTRRYEYRKGDSEESYQEGED